MSLVLKAVWRQRIMAAGKLLIGSWSGNANTEHLWSSWEAKCYKWPQSWLRPPLQEPFCRYSGVWWSQEVQTKFSNKGGDGWGEKGRREKQRDVK